ncbi:MAG: hypothetical protein QGI86_08310 [Candidatus Poribacteria bacterium]|jgi:uncharacterized phage infection (PIP) family protein YhgE|nr:hypothetical protein [Candidatus Poribacteria bacterium]MDP6745773.1 hypothetical protein [Candidatus Poribacteria bacterium]MDP6995119.1 hypothetical protein [Candidatus Poribacteria bacterium]
MRKRKAGSKIFDITEVQDDVPAVSEVQRATDTFSGEDLTTEVSALRVEVKQINQTQVQLAEAVSNLAMQVAENREIPTEVKMAQQIDLSEPMEALLTQLVSELQQIQEDVRSLSSAQTQTELALSDVQISTTGEVQALRSELSTVLENFFQKALKEGTELTSRIEQAAEKPVESVVVAEELGDDSLSELVEVEGVFESEITE